MFDEQEDEDLLIVSDDQFMDGNPIVKGTHVTVEQILQGLAQGLSIEQILHEYPQLTSEGIKAALKFAAESIRFDHITPFSTQSQEDEIDKSSPQE